MAEGENVDSLALNIYLVSEHRRDASGVENRLPSYEKLTYTVIYKCFSPREDLLDPRVEKDIDSKHRQKSQPPWRLTCRK